MQKFAILRTAKLKTLGNIGASISHTYRTRETPNAAPGRAAENVHIHAAPEGVMDALRARLPAKRRKDAVLAIEYFIGASPEWFVGKSLEDQNRYFVGAFNWLQKRHGNKNIVGCSIHRDESSPHMVAYVVPLDDSGKLNARKWTGGAAALSRMQTDFAKNVAAEHGLERGIEGSKATHQRVKQWYGEVNKPHGHVKIEPEHIRPQFIQSYGEFETPEMVAERITKGVRAAYAPSVELARVSHSNARRADEMARTAIAINKEKEALQERIAALEAEFDSMIELSARDPEYLETLRLKAADRIYDMNLEAAQRDRDDDLDGSSPSPW